MAIHQHFERRCGRGRRGRAKHVTEGSCEARRDEMDAVSPPLPHTESREDR